MTAARWEHFPHPADVGVRGWGATPAEAFEQAALAMIAVTVDPARIEPRERVAVACEAPDLESLFVEWMSSLIREADARRMLFSRFEAAIEGGALRGAAYGEPVDPARHETAAGVKGATYAELRVRRLDDGRWLAQCVLDV